MDTQTHEARRNAPWNKGKLVGQKVPLRLNEIWAIRVRLQLSHRVRELALFNLAIDSKLRACDLMKLRIQDVCHGEHIAPRAIVMQQKTQQPVQFEIMPATQKSIADWVATAALKPNDFLFPSRIEKSPHISTRQYARIVHRWVADIGLDPWGYGTNPPKLSILAATKYPREIKCEMDVVLRGRIAHQFAPRESPRGDARGGQHRSAPTRASGSNNLF